ncbi:hypothetical protein RRV45_07955 [Bacillus sp. DTU_2020_1000418_1_SI_GHA_SEK_038]|uniref:hypothetical protein n=1 Tax=Bacillus sp. DTU_2020_1000418_1_SI_GHA_SEK_038 TaxID=3077585 RepID=UPI0028EA1E4B|nr:hypothetical protein [Bacillus sp. DTU_2020_1000418_1_SI_GHA_SEK_038]WNS76907.1 hypothetical protein RRV45_07955 [Bacillus sp. DTU_2020_1000418_1_SI_GHA_SEK_038]
MVFVQFVIGMPILLKIAVTILPKEDFHSIPDWANNILSSGITVGAMATVSLNLNIPNEKRKYTIDPIQ